MSAVADNSTSPSPNPDRRLDPRDVRVHWGGSSFADNVLATTPGTELGIKSGNSAGTGPQRFVIGMTLQLSDPVSGAQPVVELGRNDLEEVALETLDGALLRVEDLDRHGPGLPEGSHGLACLRLNRPRTAGEPAFVRKL